MSTEPEYTREHWYELFEHHMQVITSKPFQQIKYLIDENRMEQLRLDGVRPWNAAKQIADKL